MQTTASNVLGKIHQTDCVEGLKKLEAGSVDLAFADPPFNIGYEYDEYDDRLESEHYLDWCGQWISELHRVLKDNGTFWLAIGDEYAAELKIESQKAGFHCRSWVIWYYTFGVHCSHKFTRSHAHLFHFVKDPKNFVYNKQEIAVPSARQRIYNDARANPKGRSPDDTWILRPQECVDGFNPDEDVWYFPRVAGTFKERAGFHGCQMPEQLLGRIIRACSNEDDVVIDPFSGSATTLAVAKKLNRNFFGFEMSVDYAALGTKRLASIAPGDPLDGSEEPLATGKDAVKKPGSKKVDPSQLSLAFPDESIRDELANEADAILQAFAETNQGYSVDRVVADPILNEDFQLACERKLIPATPAERNRFLFRLRRAGRMKHDGIDTSTVTHIDWTDISSFVFASEIAWRQMSNKYCKLSLDEILCDPRLAVQFDEIAVRFAPGHQPLDYRWAALKLKKEAKAAKRRATVQTSKQLGIEELTKKKLSNQTGSKLRDLDFSSIGEGAGVYLILDEKGDALFAGESPQLRNQLSRQFANDNLRALWLDRDAELRIIAQTVDTVSDFRLARQSLLLKWHKPAWNQVDHLGA